MFTYHKEKLSEISEKCLVIMVERHFVHLTAKMCCSKNTYFLLVKSKFTVFVIVAHL